MLFVQIWRWDNWSRKGCWKKRIRYFAHISDNIAERVRWVGRISFWLKTTNGDNFVILEMKQKLLKCYKETVERERELKISQIKIDCHPQFSSFSVEKTLLTIISWAQKTRKKNISKLSYFNEIPLGLEHEGGAARGKEEKWVKFVEINKFIMKSEIILMQWTNYGLWKTHYMRKARAAGDEDWKRRRRRQRRISHNIYSVLNGFSTFSRPSSLRKYTYYNICVETAWHSLFSWSVSKFLHSLLVLLLFF